MWPHLPPSLVSRRRPQPLRQRRRAANPKGNQAKQGSISFLKKRNKKLLIVLSLTALSRSPQALLIKWGLGPTAPAGPGQSPGLPNWCKSVESSSIRNLITRSFIPACDKQAA
jgi:hypothetical protein